MIDHFSVLFSYGQSIDHSTYSFVKKFSFFDIRRYRKSHLRHSITICIFYNHHTSPSPRPPNRSSKTYDQSDVSLSFKLFFHALEHILLATLAITEHGQADGVENPQQFNRSSYNYKSADLEFTKNRPKMHHSSFATMSNLLRQTKLRTVFETKYIQHQIFSLIDCRKIRRNFFFTTKKTHKPANAEFLQNARLSNICKVPNIRIYDKSIKFLLHFQFLFHIIQFT